MRGVSLTPLTSLAFCLILASCASAAQESCRFRVVSTVAEAAPSADGERVREVAATDLCPRGPAAERFDLERGWADREAGSTRSFSCGYVAAGEIRVIAYDIPDRAGVDYRDVLHHARREARRFGLHGLLLERIVPQRDGLWFEFMGAYRKDEVPPGFEGLK